MTHASSGMVASLLTALITPRETTTVAFSRRVPETGTTVTPRIAKYCGSPPCAAQRVAPNRPADIAAATPNADLTFEPEDPFRNSFVLDCMEGANQPPTSR